jgi:hypothetical protein
VSVTGVLMRRIRLPAAVITTAQPVFLTAVFAALLLSACYSRKPLEIPRPTAQSFPALQEEVSKMRGLQFKRQPTFSPEPIEAGADVAAEYGAQPIVPIAHVYKRLGLVPESVDLSKALLEFSRLQRIVDYDAARAIAVGTPEAAKAAQALAGEQSRRAPSIPGALALTLALQEQHFRWHTRLRTIPAEDRKLAFRAIAYGDAVLVGLRYLAGDRRTDDFTDQLRAIARLSVQLDKIGSALPAMLREKLVFPYREGGRFVQWAYAARGWDGVNTLFSDPPFSTAQILHPEKYYVSRKQPVRILPFGLFEKMIGTPIVDHTVGEALVAVLLEASRSRKEATRIAAGWEGDHLSAYPDGDSFVTAWISAWSDDSAARMFGGAYQTSLERRHRLRFEPSPRQQGWAKADIGGGRSVVLEVRGPFVLLIDGVASARVREVTESAWKDLETNPESTVIPFDSAAGLVQFSNR